MKIFEVVQRHYAILGISGSTSHQSENLYLFKQREGLGFFLFGCTAVSQFVYTFHVANGFLEHLVCICTTTASVIVFVGFAAIVYRKTTLFENIKNCEKFIDARCKFPKSRRLYSKANRQVERLSEVVFMVVVKIVLQIIMLPKCMVSIVSYFITGSASDSFQLPVPMWFPFDWSNPTGYLIAVIVEYIIFGHEYFVIACTLGLGIGAFWIAVSATKEIRYTLNLINHEAKAKTNHSAELKISFSECINAHATVKQVEHDFSEILQPIIMSLFTYSIFAISSAMLILQIDIFQTHDGDAATKLLPVVNGIIALALVFITCELGQRMGDAFEEIGITIDQYHWYLFPIEIKRMLPTVIAIAKQPVTLECFGSIACSREIFKNVIHCAYTYFMVFREISD